MAVSPRPARGAEAPQGPESPKELVTQFQLLQSREDVCSSKSVVKRFRRLCRDYDEQWNIEGAHTRQADVTVLQASLLPPPQEEESSSSSEEDGFERGKEGLGNHARWPQIKEYLDKLETQNRVRAVKDISTALNKAALQAEAHLQELEELEKTDAVDESNLSINEELLKFRTDNTAAVQAVKRCIDVAPDLYRRVSNKLAAAKQREKQKLGSAADDAEKHISDDNSNSDSDEEDGTATARGEVLNRLQRLGTLPRSADKELHIVLEVQREEIRTAAQRSSDGEKRVKVARLAIEYMDGNVDPDSVDADTLNAAITLAQELKSSQFEARREEALAKRREMRNGYNIPTEVEVQDAIDECERLFKESVIVEERVQRLLETTNPKVESGAAALDQVRHTPEQTHTPTPVGSEHEREVSATANGKAGSKPNSPRASPAPPPLTLSESGSLLSSSRQSVQSANLSPSYASRRRANRTNVAVTGLANPALSISIEDAPEKHSKMKQELTDLEAKIAQQLSCISDNEAVMRNAEHTLKVLEETKTLFLEEVAREKPTMIEAFGIVSPEKEADVSSESDDSDDDDPGGADLLEKLQQLDAEQEFLRFELSMAEENDDDEDTADVKMEPLENDVREGDDRPETSEEDRAFVDIRRLAYRVEQEMRQPTKASPVSVKGDKDCSDTGSGSDSDAESEKSKSDPDSDEDNEQALSPEVAARLLQSETHHEMQELLRLRDENLKMLEKLKEVKQEIRTARSTQGAIDLKHLDGIDASPEKLAELQQKVRELQVLRKRWWRERQEDQTTVRRALATRDLDMSAIEEIEEEAPLPTTEASLFQRILTSMTLP